jgi:hypothetical protein
VCLDHVFCRLGQRLQVFWQDQDLRSSDLFSGYTVQLHQIIQSCIAYTSATARSKSCCYNRTHEYIRGHHQLIWLPDMIHDQNLNKRRSCEARAYISTVISLNLELAKLEFYSQVKACRDVMNSQQQVD